MQSYKLVLKILNNKTRNIILLFVCAVLFCLFNIDLLSAKQEDSEDWKNLDKKARAKIQYTLILEDNDETLAALMNPKEMILDKILKGIKKKNGITIVRHYLIDIEKCLNNLLRGRVHLAKISTGHRISKMEFKLTSESSRASIWSGFEDRRLVDPILKIKVFYDDNKIVPTEKIYKKQ